MINKTKCLPEYKLGNFQCLGLNENTSPFVQTADISAMLTEKKKSHVWFSI